jgi:uncharacterized protein YkwD
MKRKIVMAILGALIGAVALGATAFAATTYAIPDNYAEILAPGAIKWSDKDSTGHNAGAVVEVPSEGIGTLVCYYVPDDYYYWKESLVTRESDKGTYYFAIGYVPGGPMEYKRDMADILCTADETGEVKWPTIFVEDLQVKFGDSATATASPAPSATAKPTAVPTTTAEPKTLTDAEFAAEVIRLINAERENAGVKPLAIDEKLCEIATLKAVEMVELKYFSHNSPNYGNQQMFAKHYGYKNYGGVAENLHWGHIAKPSEVVESWLNSVKGHKEAMLNPAYTKAGFGFDGNKYALELAKK